ncbi:TsaB family protein [Hydrogenobaculum sp.]|nr:MAG: molecular chaperone, inactive metal-dependent protease like protein [Hydrogenobaculum sp.]
MLILSLDTSSSNVSFCLLKASKPVLSFYKKTNEKTLNLLPFLFNTFDIKPKEIDAFFVCIGIGYATPLRIGINFIKAMCIALEKPIYTFINIDAVARTMFSHDSLFLYRKVSNAYVGAYYESGKRVSDIAEYKELPDVPSKDVEEYEHMFSYLGYEAFKKENPSDLFFVEPIYTRPPTRVF